MRFILPAFAVFIAATCALPTYKHVVHEKRDRLPAQWVKRDKMDSSAVLPVRVGLKQRNLDKAHEYLNSVSNPKSKKYGQHWSISEITETFAPSSESTDAVLQWLAENGVVTAKMTGALHTIELEMSVAEVERLLKTEYHVYENTETGQGHVACEEYNVPAHISEHINIITPTIHFDVKPKPALKKRDIPNPADPVTGYHPYHDDTKSSNLPSAGAGNSTDVQSCVDAITPDCLRALYNIPDTPADICGNNSYGIVEYDPNSYIAADLDAFFAKYIHKAAGERPDFVAVHDGTIDVNNPTDFNHNGESNLDLEYAMALVYPQKTTLYEIGTTNNDASDASFIQTKVVSASWGYNENALSAAYMETLCNEYMKLGLQGVSVIFSTADNGVAGNTQECTDNKFQPDFPATCPYVTAIGATEVDPSITSLATILAAGNQPEMAINNTVKSGGGFSNVFALPSYQTDVVTSYLETNPPPYGADKYNNTGKVRAIPDLSVNGANYQVFVDGALTNVDGTSASTPVFGAMITLVNEARLSQGKSSLGFLNPAIYQNADAFIRDVVNGSNPGCGTDGFEAVAGWDPVTGLGTPDFAAMMDVFVDL
ncbi:subtilisin-like protein [Lepidopterella palustris CBS 459.81]|uniref:tripeptidyl-peptidase II n=1 Tax=Lepidopterella palustris CBS 459.81 TaxID=1314670 RepID=A0A8E2EB20_9PEZI|nr:subtilisin-like protein [Lepidopterella palustris CBS 459.81]